VSTNGGASPGRPPVAPAVSCRRGPPAGGPHESRLEHSGPRAGDEFGEFASEDLPYYSDWRVSFEQLPWALDEQALRRADGAIVGAPFHERVSSRPGARFGPRVIRMAPTAWSRTARWSIQLQTGPHAHLTVQDAGDAPVAPGWFERPTRTSRLDSP
jgi:hypothetical protein